MKVLVLGGSGMAGHVIAAYLLKRTGHEVTVTVRTAGDIPVVRQACGVADSAAQAGAAEDGGRTALAVRVLDVRRFEQVADLFAETQPDLIVNAVGVLNRQAEDLPLDAYLVNGLLPHWLRHLCRRGGGRLIHISSDCVFLGDRGGYTEEERPDGETVYARSKALGEITDPACLTLRTSIIGPELRSHGIGLLKWFLGSSGSVSGYVNVQWNGVTTLELAKAVEWAMEHPDVGGLVHLTAPEAVNKHDLLGLFAETFGRTDVKIVPEAEPAIDRTLAPTKSGFDYRPPGYAQMLAELRQWMEGEAD
ncbi:dTDP-4-dehydrorhamnose reductase family protein [Cohnella sp. GCM10020058]|uniref:dTDP-4-dehydrorhamnose reductase family protein n=1 Tax=Cohnella sp. GCM10020058 TaxID=3317330 RepID=UPI0036283B4A